MGWQPVEILYPDVELLVPTALRPLIVTAGEAGVYVGRSIPANRPDRMVLVNRDGGGSNSITDQPRIRVRVWDVDEQKANDLARLVVRLMPRLVGTTAVTRVQHLSGPFEVPDAAGVTGPQQRYLLFQLDIEGVTQP